MSQFAHYSAQLKNSLEVARPFKTDKTIRIQQYDGFIKGDVSGIQDFIFSVRSEGASKSLKSRSHFVGVLTDICVAMIEQNLGKANFELVYNGGGNFYGFIKGYKPDWEKWIQQKIDAALVHESIYISLTAIPIPKNTSDFGAIWQQAEAKSGQTKQAKLKTLSFERVFNPFEKTPLFNSKHWSDFTQRLTHSNSFVINPLSTEQSTKIESSYFHILGYEYRLDVPSNNTFTGQITNKLPLMGRKEVKTFEELADEAHTRTGSKKLAVLKVDVDDLGKTFQGIQDVNRGKAVSESLSQFFNQHFYELWSKHHFSDGLGGKHFFSDNIYPVFAGGDDCFLIGAWDSVFEFAHLLQQQFKSFTNGKITLSGGLLVIDPHFPVVRFAEMAESALKNAKSNERNTKGDYVKSKISVFGEVLTWEEYQSAKKIAWQLYVLIKVKGESRAILDRIKRSKVGFDHLQKIVLEKGIIRAQSVWRLKYFLRNSKETNKVELAALTDEYAKLLLDVFLKGNEKNPNLFPVAARWAEFLTKSS